MWELVVLDNLVEPVRNRAPHSKVPVNTTLENLTPLFPCQSSFICGLFKVYCKWQEAVLETPHLSLCCWFIIHCTSNSLQMPFRLNGLILKIFHIEGLVQNYRNYIFFRKSLFYIFLFSNMKYKHCWNFNYVFNVFIRLFNNAKMLYLKKNILFYYTLSLIYYYFLKRNLVF